MEGTGADTSIWQWAYGILLTVFGGSIVYLFKRQDDLRTEMAGSLEKLAKSSAEAIKSAGDESARAIREVIRDGEEGRRRLWERVNTMDQAGHDARLDDSRRYVTKADLAEQTEAIKDLIDNRKKVT